MEFIESKFNDLPALIASEIKSNHRDVSQYQSFFPIDLLFETVHPDHLAQHFTVVVFTPFYQYSSTISYEDPHNPVHRQGLHHHTYFELIYVLHGTMYQNIEHKRHLYSKGSLCLLNRNIHHAEEFTSDFRAAFISLPVPLVDELFNHRDQFYFPIEQSNSLQELETFFNHNINDSSISVREYIDFIPKENHAAELSDMYARFQELTHIFLNPSPGASFLLKGILLQIFSALANKELYDNIPINIGTEHEAHLFDKISALMTLKNGRMTRSELSAHLKYDGSYLNYIVKKYSGLNLFGYGSAICMKEAERLLRETEMSVAEIAEALHFTNRTHFYRIFKAYYSLTPRQYRQSLKR